MEPKYLIEEYVDEAGAAPFGKWLLGLKDKRAQARIRARITRASFGNFGDWKKVTGPGSSGLYEMREHHGPGYRVYYSVVGQTILLLLAGSTKKDQNKAIAAAQARLADYETRSQTDD
ncbi:MAG: type II toxin-antitoxin system RelE/ParE family toxin [Planctomycetota bacterium]